MEPVVPEVESVVSSMESIPEPVMVVAVRAAVANVAPDTVIVPEAAKVILHSL